ncbi:hypothetical protein MRX96_027385 [Rhipicephalus microplus]
MDGSLSTYWYNSFIITQTTPGRSTKTGMVGGFDGTAHCPGEVETTKKRRQHLLCGELEGVRIALNFVKGLDEHEVLIRLGRYGTAEKKLSVEVAVLGLVHGVEQEASVVEEANNVVGACSVAVQAEDAPQPNCLSQRPPTQRRGASAQPPIDAP